MDPYLLELDATVEHADVDDGATARLERYTCARPGFQNRLPLSLKSHANELLGRGIRGQPKTFLGGTWDVMYRVVLEKQAGLTENDRLALVHLDSAVNPTIAEVDVGPRIYRAMGEVPNIVL